MLGLIEEAEVPLDAVGLEVASVRLLAAAVLGALIGLDREWRRRPAGLRTHMLICVAAALFSIVALEAVRSPLFSDEHVRVDPLRVLEAITAGIAFLAAGTILARGGQVKGLTTGASMWLAGGIGACAGFGYLQLAGVAVGITLVILTLLYVLEPRPEKKDEDSS